MGFLDVLAWIVMGGLAGWVASLIMKKNGSGLILNIVIGIVGAFVGGFIMTQVGATGITGFKIWSFQDAVGGAIIVLAIVNLFTKGRGK